MTRKSVAALMLLSCGAWAANLQLLPGGAIAGGPGETVGWGFRLTSDAVDDGGTNIVPWLVINNADFVLDPGVLPVGVFTPWITLAFQPVGPDTGNGELNPWSENFDAFLLTGIGSYAIDDFQIPGSSASGEVVLTYDLFRVSPNDPSFNPITDTIANGLTVSAEASVLVTPEPGYGTIVLLTGCLLTVLGMRVTHALQTGV